MWSMKGLDFGWFFGVPKVWDNSSFIKTRCKFLEVEFPSAIALSASWKAWSNESRGLLYFKEFPDIFNSYEVTRFWTWNLMLGPTLVFASHMYKSLLLLASKNMHILQVLLKQSSAMSSLAPFLSILLSFLE